MEKINTSQKDKNEYYTTILKMGEKEHKSQSDSRELKNEGEQVFILNSDQEDWEVK